MRNRERRREMLVACRVLASLKWTCTCIYTCTYIYIYMYLFIYLFSNGQFRSPRRDGPPTVHRTLAFALRPARTSQRELVARTLEYFMKRQFLERPARETRRTSNVHPLCSRAVIILMIPPDAFLFHLCPRCRSRSQAAGEGKIRRPLSDRENGNEIIRNCS